MMKHWRWLPILALAGTLLATGVAVRTHAAGLPQPPSAAPLPGPAPAQGPQIGVLVHGTGAQGGTIAYPSNFQFSADLSGAGFKAGEHIVISASHTGVNPLTLTADNAGAFSTHVDFTWVFCGPSGQAQPAPVFTAVGNAGSHAEVDVAAPRCPMLIAANNQIAPAPIQKPVSGQPQPVYTAVVINPGAAPPPNSPPAQVASSQPEPFAMQGFGFVPGESVIIQGTGAVPSGRAAPMHATADTEGRIAFTIQLAVPSGCGASVPRLIAAGNKGTAVEAPLFIAPMMLCPNRATGAPEPASPAGSTAVNFSLTVHPATIRRGQITHIRLQTPTAGTAQLVLQSPGNHSLHRTVSIGGRRAAALSWRIPRGIHTGKGTLSAIMGGSTLQAPITIR
jgi:hypothetical protein